jgi:hypothetical protein
VTAVLAKFGALDAMMSKWKDWVESEQAKADAAQTMFEKRTGVSATLATHDELKLSQKLVDLERDKAEYAKGR